MGEKIDRKNANQTTKREGKSEGPQNSARQLGCVTRIGARNPRSTCCDAEGPGPGDIHIRLVRHFMCRLYVLQEPHPAVSGQLEVFLNGQLGQIPPVAQTSISLCPARACRQLITPHMKRGGQREAAEAKKEGRGDKEDEEEVRRGKRRRKVAKGH